MTAQIYGLRDEVVPRYAIHMFERRHQPVNEVDANEEAMNIELFTGIPLKVIDDILDLMRKTADSMDMKVPVRRGRQK